MPGRDDATEATLAVELINDGAELTAGIVGGAVGSIAGPLGVVGGAAAGVATARVFQRVGAEIQQRVMAPRERMRAGAAYAFAADSISARVMMGDHPRADGFFEPTSARRSPAEELLEGTLAAAADAYEERKVRFLGCLYASLVFDTRISRPYANLLINLADELRFRQLCLMAILVERDYAALIEAAPAKAPLIQPRPPDDLALDVDELERLGLLGRDGPGASYRREGANLVNASSLTISSLNLTDVGVTLYESMNLRTIPPDARQEVLDEFVVEVLAEDPELR